MELTTILCILLLSLYLLLAVFWIVRSVIDAIDDHERKKRDDAWEAEKQQLASMVESSFYPSLEKRVRHQQLLIHPKF